VELNQWMTPTSIYRATDEPQALRVPDGLQRSWEVIIQYLITNSADIDISIFVIVDPGHRDLTPTGMDGFAVNP
jgi:hypothetical protein